MAEAFTAGVKIGGLTNDTEIRILLCYLIKSVGPVTREAMEAALLQEELVNYFEFCWRAERPCSQGLAIEGTKRLHHYRKRYHSGSDSLGRFAPQRAGKCDSGSYPHPELGAQGGPEPCRH